ncbi:NAD-dependent epimerase/dehydratase family protein [Amorphoplanes nipponensis]|uniref:Reductase n=1 Tax=Actinoplanes nipponensis TaxID=135950 RepID=A0A919JIS5_9ACTN|nr:NAD-dependent epimerase/dehydratase family protein [Actinoplanes nipponensis]GIE51508.1 reductase [Actinoplanes nipponensis]
MRLLILGGSWFLGRSIAEVALADGWQVSTFNRGTHPDLPEVDAVHGDRTSVEDFRRLASHGPWDAVIDCIAFTPRDTYRGALALAPVVGHYVVMSTVNAYTGWPDLPLSENSARYECPVDADADYAAEHGELIQYGTLKAGCEQAVRQAIGDERTTVLRPGVILGPHEYVGRLPWWLLRAAAGGQMLAPAPADRPIQPIDARDLAAFALRCARQRIAGDINVTAPIGHASFADLVDACAEVTAAGAEPVWVDPTWLAQQGVGEWTELPLWRTRAGVWNVDSSRAQAAGLTCRPLRETVADTWSWMTGGGEAVKEEQGEAARAAEHGLSAEREAALLDRWRQLR